MYCKHTQVFFTLTFLKKHVFYVLVAINHKCHKTQSNLRILIYSAVTCHNKYLSETHLLPQGVCSVAGLSVRTVTKHSHDCHRLRFFILPCLPSDKNTIKI